jgi:hypothetical protein
MVSDRPEVIVSGFDYAALRSTLGGRSVLHNQGTKGRPKPTKQGG